MPPNLDIQTESGAPDFVNGLLGLVHTGHEIGDPIAAVGSLIIFADTLLFAWLVFQVRPAETLATRPIIPAE